MHRPLSAVILSGVFAFGCGSATSDPTMGGMPPGAPVAPDPSPLPPPPPSPSVCHGAPYPIILAHGMAGFESIGPINYFFNVAADLRLRGETVFESQVSPYDSSTVRGAQLAKFIDDTLAATSACKVNIIAHSQGGIDARFVISTLHYGDRIGALATVSTPHRGTPVADVGTGLVGGFSASVVNAILLAVQGLTSNGGSQPDIQANLTQLTTQAMSQFNAENPDDPHVSYFSAGGRSNLSLGASECSDGLWPNPSGVDAVDPLLVATAAIFPFFSADFLSPMANDGLVPIASARWGQFLGCVPADHFDEVGQIADSGSDLISGFNHIDFYRSVVAEIHKAGL